MWFSLAVLLLLDLPQCGHALQPQPPPICSSCEDYCAGRCSLRGPRGASGEPNSRTVQNITVYRMTAANVTDLSNKDTGDAAGDLVFNMGERARPMECRHESQKGAGSVRECDGGSTQSWLLKNSLVYLEWVVEVDGNWGPYQPCNLNITGRGGEPGDHRWHCGPARVLLKDNMTDATLCKTCPRAATAVGWEDQNHSVAAYQRRSSAPTAACNRTARQLCAEHMGNFSSCKHCLSLARKQLEVNGCALSKLLTSLCPRPPMPSAPCVAAAQKACGSLRQPQLRRNCSRCLETNHSRTAIRAACGQLGEESLMYSHWCPKLEPEPDYNANTTFVEWRPNPRLISEKLGGSWFSTPAAGECTGYARPGDGSGCTWRPVRLQKAINYTCLQVRTLQLITTVLLWRSSAYSKN